MRLKYIHSRRQYVEQDSVMKCCGDGGRPSTFTLSQPARWSALSSLNCTYKAVTEFTSLGASRTQNKRANCYCTAFCTLRLSGSAPVKLLCHKRTRPDNFSMTLYQGPTLTVRNIKVNLLSAIIMENNTTVEDPTFISLIFNIRSLD